MSFKWNSILYLIAGLTVSGMSPREALGSDKSESLWDEAYYQHVEPSVRHGFDATGWSILGAGAVATVVARQHDDGIRQKYGHKKVFSEDLSRFAAIWGSGAVGIGTASAQLYFDYDNGVAHGKALAFTSFNHITMAALVRRGRPHKPDSWTSFPSGHSSSAFATASSLSQSYGLWAAVPLYGAAMVTMAGRVSDDVHWFSDTVAGATLGIFWGRATAFQGDEIKLVPIFNHDSKGLGMTWRF